jgi:hypothetical protein
MTEHASESQGGEQRDGLLLAVTLTLADCLGGAVKRRCRRERTWRSTVTAVTYQQWKAMDARERKRLRRKWDPYRGDGVELVQAAAAELATRLKEVGVTRVSHGLYHGGTWVIVVEHTAPVSLPRSFEEFAVITRTTE